MKAVAIFEEARRGIVALLRGTTRRIFPDRANPNPVLGVPVRVQINEPASTTVGFARILPNVREEVTEEWVSVTEFGIFGGVVWLGSSDGRVVVDSNGQGVYPKFPVLARLHWAHGLAIGKVIRNDLADHREKLRDARRPWESIFYRANIEFRNVFRERLESLKSQGSVQIHHKKVEFGYWNKAGFEWPISRGPETYSQWVLDLSKEDKEVLEVLLEETKTEVIKKFQPLADEAWAEFMNKVREIKNSLNLPDWVWEKISPSMGGEGVLVIEDTLKDLVR